MEAASTIVQLATPRAPAAIHLLRVSGPLALSFLRRRTPLKTIKPRYAHHTPFFKLLPGSSKRPPVPIDHGIALFFPAPHSYTGEDLVEIHCHGSLQLVDTFLELAVQEDLRLAEPGEFTKRAFLNGKLSLTQAEAVDTLIRSSGTYLRSNALALLEKRAAFRFSHFKAKLMQLLGGLEATLEFPEEESVSVFSVNRALALLTELSNYLSQLQRNYEVGIREQNGVRVALLGAPNAGKSTLLNLLLSEERALVSEEAGTTRDYLSERITFPGFPIKFHFFDTAGLRETAGKLEQLGIKQTLRVAAEAELLIILISSKGALKTVMQRRLEFDPTGRKPKLFFLNKTDYFKKFPEEREAILQGMEQQTLSFTAELSLTEAPTQALKAVTKAVKHWARQAIPTFKALETQALERRLAFLNQRQLQVGLKIQKGLEKLKQQLQAGTEEEIIIEELRYLTAALDELGVSFDNEAVFDAIFKNFCLGK